MKLKALLCVIFIGVSASAAESNTSRRLSFRKGIKEFAESREVSKDFVATLATIDIKHSLRQTPRLDIDNEVLCMVCDEVVNLVMEELQTGSNPQDLVDVIIELCVLLEVESREVCAGTITISADPVLYIAQNRPNLTGAVVCATFLQDNDCVADLPALDVRIPEGQTIDVEKGLQSDANPIKILQLTDNHYDPHYLIGGNANCNEPLCCQSDKGLAENAADAAGYWGDYRDCDSPKHALDEAYQHIREQHSDIDYIFFTGDVISHRVWDTTRENNSMYLYQTFTDLYETFPDIPIFPIFGNHEPHPLNGFAPPSVTAPELSTNWLYEEMAELWGKWLPEDTKETILQGGYYTVLVRPGFRVIGINSNVGYTFNWWILYETDTITAQLQWLADTLYEAEQNSEFVHILTHISAGDGTAYIPYSTQFWRIVERFANTITGMFYGHSHWDEWLLYHSATEPTKPINIAWNGGSLTTFSNLNRNYKIYTVDGENFEVLDVESWTYNLTQANLNPGVPPEWFKLYSFKDAYNVNNLSPAEIRNLLIRTADDNSIMQMHYTHRYRNADTRGYCDRYCMLGDLCRMVVVVRGELTQCNELTALWN